MFEPRFFFVLELIAKPAPELLSSCCEASGVSGCGLASWLPHLGFPPKQNEKTKKIKKGKTQGFHFLAVIETSYAEYLE